MKKAKLGMPLDRRGFMGTALAGVLIPEMALAEIRRPRRTAFRAIRYGRAERFGPATLEPFTEQLIQDERGPVCPQGPGLVMTMGLPSVNRQNEHCQVLSVFTPSRQGKRAVLVFIHGGAFLTGGGEMSWYDGDRLAAEQDIVVVSISYRLGAFGFRIAHPNTSMSPGFSDVVTALEWVQKYIHMFGGDPANVTLCGQSAGSAIAMVLTDFGFGGKLFQRVIAMSGNHLSATRTGALEHTRIFDETLGSDPTKASPEAIVAAQRRIKIGSSTSPFWLPMAPTQPSKINVDVLAGSLSEDLSFAVLRSQNKPPRPGTPLDEFRLASEPLSRDMRRYAQEAAAEGCRAYAYLFTWAGPDTGFGNTHTIDLPFLFGNWVAWKAAPMLAGVSMRDFERMGRLLRGQWAAFARTGSPQIRGGPTWVRATAENAPVTRLS